MTQHGHAHPETVAMLEEVIRYVITHQSAPAYFTRLGDWVCRMANPAHPLAAVLASVPVGPGTVPGGRRREAWAKTLAQLDALDAATAAGRPFAEVAHGNQLDRASGDAVRAERGRMGVAEYLLLTAHGWDPDLVEPSRAQRKLLDSDADAERFPRLLKAVREHADVHGRADDIPAIVVVEGYILRNWWNNVLRTWVGSGYRNHPRKRRALLESGLDLRSKRQARREGVYPDRTDAPGPGSQEPTNESGAHKRRRRQQRGEGHGTD